MSNTSDEASNFLQKKIAIREAPFIRAIGQRVNTYFRENNKTKYFKFHNYQNPFKEYPTARFALSFHFKTLKKLDNPSLTQFTIG